MNGAVLKTAMPHTGYRGVESHPLRHDVMLAAMERFAKEIRGEFG